MFRRSPTFLRLSVSAFALCFSVVAHANPVDFDQAAQPLGQALRQVAGLAGLTVAVDGALVAGKAAPALKGKYEPEEALRHLLAGSGLTVKIEGSNALITQQTGAVELEPVKVASTKPVAEEGSAEAGYLVKSESATGTFWGKQTLQDTPYSVSVVSAELMQNLQVYDEQTALKYIPGVQTGNNAQNMTGTSSFTIRGFNFAGSSTSSGQTFEGMQNQGGFEFTPIEDKERLELLSGLNGFMYGVGNVGGEINAVLKRPTETPLYSVEVGNNAGDNFYIHGDFGGPISDKFGYRVNVVEQNGNTAYTGQSVSRYLLSGAFDIRPADNYLLQLNASTEYYNLRGPTPFYILSSKAGAPALTQYPSPPNPDSIKTYSQAEHFDRTNVAGIKQTWDINDTFSLRSQYNWTGEYLNPDLAMYQKIFSDGTFQINPYAGGQSFYYQTHSYYTYLDSSFDTGPVKHKITTGYNGFYQVASMVGNSVTWPATVYPYGNFYAQDASSFNLPNPTVTGAIDHKQGDTYASNYMIGDSIDYDKFNLQLAGNDATWTSISFNSASQKTGGYSSSAVTPAVALSYKVTPKITPYVSYQQSLQPGTVVANSGSTIYTNAGAILPPYMGNQYEVGTKATLADGLLATIAAYTINKANLYSTQNPNGTWTYYEGGSIHDDGIAITLTGKATPDLTLCGGTTLEDPKVRNNPASPWQNGQLEQDASPFSAKMYAEYNLPFIEQAQFLRSITLTGGVSYTGPYHGNIRSSYTTMADEFPGYTVIDLGFRYATEVYGHPATFRFTATNVTNAAYWAATGLEGPPIAFMSSLQLKW